MQIRRDGSWLLIKLPFIPFAITLSNYLKVRALASLEIYQFMLFIISGISSRGKIGGYVFLGATEIGRESSVSRLSSPPFFTGNTTQCLSFHFAMAYSGPNTTLVVYRYIVII